MGSYSSELGGGGLKLLKETHNSTIYREESFSSVSGAGIRLLERR